MVQTNPRVHKTPLGVGGPRDPMPSTQPFLFLNGTLYAANAPVVRADDAGFLHAWGAFETIRLLDGRPIAAARHLARLARTLDRLRIDADLAPLGAQMARLAALNQPGREARARITVTGGVHGIPTVLVQVDPLGDRVAGRRGGVACRAVEAPRALAALKTLAWIGPRLALLDAAADEEPLRCAGDEVLEGVTTNVFCATPEAVITPPADDRLLPGIAREVLLEVLAWLGIAYRIRPLPFATLARYGGVVTNALLPVAPIRSVAGQPTPPVPWLAAVREVFDEVAG